MHITYPESLMTDAVIYANENSDKKASVQFGVRLSSIRLWRKRLSKLPSKPHCKLTKSPSNFKCSPERPLDRDAEILIQWVEEKMNDNEFPSLTTIGNKAKALHLRLGLCSKNGADSLLRKTGVHKRWSVGARLRISGGRKPLPVEVVKNNHVPASTLKPRNAKVYDLNRKMDREIAGWLNRRLNFSRTPTLKLIGMKRQEVGRRNGACTIKDFGRWGLHFLVRTNMKGRWQNALRKENNLMHKDGKSTRAKKLLKTGYINPHKIEEVSMDDASTFADTRGIEYPPKRYKISRKNTPGKLMNKVVDVSTPPRMAYHAVMEDKILNWILAEYPNRKPPRQSVVMKKAHDIVKEFNIKDFTPTENWYRLFMQRNLDHIKALTCTVPISPTEEPQQSRIVSIETVETGISDKENDDTVTPSSQRQSDRSEYRSRPVIVTGDSVNSYSSDEPTSRYSSLIADPVVKEEHSESMVDEIPQPLNETFEPKYDPSVIPPMLARDKCDTGRITNTTANHVERQEFESPRSFDVKKQLRFAETAAYNPPELPVRPPMFEEYSSLPCKFGSTVRKKHFFLEQDCLFLNHGAFGGTMKEALDYYHDWQRYVESQPLRFFDRILFPQIVHVQKRLANFIGCKPSDITFTTNVTTAINGILQGLPLCKDSTIYYLSLTNGVVRKTIRRVCERNDAQAIEVTVTLPLSKLEDIVSLVRSTLNSMTTLAVFEHVSSDYGFILPVKELVSVCHQRGVQVLINGAHGLGQLNLDLSILGADYYIGSCHKWFCAPKGCAFMYVNQQLQRLTRELIISDGYEEGFHSQFVWTGVKDYCSYLSLHALINFWTTVSPNKIREYCKSLLKEAVDYFKMKWDAELLAPIECHGMMCCVSLPAALCSRKASAPHSDTEAIQNQLYSEFKIEVPIKCIENKLYMSISAHIYNEFSEYTSLATALLNIAASRLQGNRDRVPSRDSVQ